MEYKDFSRTLYVDSPLGRTRRSCSLPVVVDFERDAATNRLAGGGASDIIADKAVDSRYSRYSRYPWVSRVHRGVITFERYLRITIDILQYIRLCGNPYTSVDRIC